MLQHAVWLFCVLVHLRPPQPPGLITQKMLPSPLCVVWLLHTRGCYYSAHMYTKEAREK